MITNVFQYLHLRCFNFIFTSWISSGVHELHLRSIKFILIFVWWTSCRFINCIFVLLTSCHLHCIAISPHKMFISMKQEAMLMGKNKGGHNDAVILPIARYTIPFKARWSRQRPGKESQQQLWNEFSKKEHCMSSFTFWIVLCLLEGFVSPVLKGKIVPGTNFHAKTIPVAKRSTVITMPSLSIRVGTKAQEPTNCAAKPWTAHIAHGLAKASLVLDHYFCKSCKHLHMLPMVHLAYSW